ncbi:MAG: maleylacetoacetate isomerase [Xanthomonadales bacterium]
MPERTGADLLLYGYWRSSSAYRVRIALNLKRLEYRQQAVHLVRGGGEQHEADYRAVNPLGLVPALRHGSRTIVQSTAICEYLEETFPETPLLPGDAPGRARVRSMVQTVCSEIQPLNNLGVMAYLKAEMGLGDEAVSRWYAHWIARGFAALESWLGMPDSGAFCHGDAPTLADCFLIPQVYNAERFACDLQPYPRIRAIATRCRALPAFRRAAPEQQADAE